MAEDEDGTFEAEMNSASGKTIWREELAVVEEIVGFFMLREAYADSLRRFVEGPRGIQEPTLKEMSSMLMASAPTSDRSRQ